MEKTIIEKCGCEFLSVWDNMGSMCILIKCKCQEHYNDQLKAEWYDHEGHHSIIREPKEVSSLILLEVEA